MTRRVSDNCTISLFMIFFIQYSLQLFVHFTNRNINTRIILENAWNVLGLFRFLILQCANKIKCSLILFLNDFSFCAWTQLIYLIANLILSYYYTIVYHIIHIVRFFAIFFIEKYSNPYQRMFLYKFIFNWWFQSQKWSKCTVKPGYLTIFVTGINIEVCSLRSWNIEAIYWKIVSINYNEMIVILTCSLNQALLYVEITFNVTNSHSTVT